MKNAVFWDVTPCGSCKNDFSEETSVSIIRVTRIGELGTRLDSSRKNMMDHKETAEHQSVLKWKMPSSWM
jgi:hypothetical protein